MSLRNRINQTTTSVRANLNNKWATITDRFSAAVGRSANALTGLINGTTLVGMNVNGIPEIKEANRAAVRELEQILEGFNSVGDPRRAFAGQYAVAIQRFMDTASEATKAIATSLLEFNDKLDQVGTNYVVRDGEVVAAIGDAEANMDTTRFVEQDSGVQGWN